MNKEEIMQLLPHREPMLLIDDAAVENGEAVGHYHVRGDEFFLQGHFPENPIVPGVILCEILAQSACVLLGTQKPRARIVFGAITFFLCASLGGSNLIAFAAGIYDNSLYFFPSLTAVGFAVYTAWQLLREPASEEQLEKAEQTEEEIPAE